MRGRYSFPRWQLATEVALQSLVQISLSIISKYGTTVSRWQVELASDNKLGRATVFSTVHYTVLYKGLASDIKLGRATDFRRQVYIF